MIFKLIICVVVVDDLFAYGFKRSRRVNGINKVSEHSQLRLELL
jgi:hypothetical protein